MRTVQHIATFLLCMTLAGCSSVQGETQTRQKLDSSVDDLCSWTGLKRSGPVNAIKRYPTDDFRYTVTVGLDVDGSVRPFEVGFDSQHHIRTFAPELFNLSNLRQGLGYDAVKDPKTRARCIAAVNKLNQHLKWIWYGRAAIQRMGQDFVVTYETLSAGELMKLMKKGSCLDPYVSFVVTRIGTVFVTFIGA